MYSHVKMRYIKFILAVFCLQNASAYLDSKLIETLERASENGNISSVCHEALNLYTDNLKSFTLWAIQMFDATSKIPVGITSLNFGEFGQFSQCLAIASDDGLIEGKYCLVSLSFQNMNYTSGENDLYVLQERAVRMRQALRSMVPLTASNDSDVTPSLSPAGITWALCLPSNCSDGDVAEMVKNVIDIATVECQTKEDLHPPLTNGAIATIAVLSIFAFIMVVSTLVDLHYQYKKEEPPHLILIAFSVYSNGSKLFRISKNSNELACLNGIRFWSMMWVLIGHVYMTFATNVVNYVDVMKWLDSLRSMTIVNGTLSVDSFFFLGGLLLFYSFMKTKYHGRRFNIFQFYIHRYLRLTPALAATTLVAAHLLKYLGTGPYWQHISAMEQPCQKYWWLTILYVQNYVNEESNYCLDQTWYLCIDMQLFILSPLILIPLWKYPKLGVGLITVGIVTFIVVPFTIGYITEIPVFLTNFQARVPVDDYLEKYYFKTHTRAAPWFIGAMTGYVLAKIKFQGEYKHPALNKFTICLLWTVCLVLVLTCIYAGHSTLMGADYARIASSFYLGFIRPVWALCLAWVVYACVIGYGDPVNWLLSLPVYQVLNRFTYSVYLLHFSIVTVYHLSMKTGIYFDDLTMAYSFWGLTGFSFLLSVIWVLAFESPVVVLEKIIFGSSEKGKNPGKNGISA